MIEMNNGQYLHEVERVIRKRLYFFRVLGGEIDQLPKFLAKLAPKDRLDVVVKLLEFTLPRLKGIEATIEKPEDDKPSIDLGRLTREQRKEWYALYDLARIKSNGQADEVDQVKTQDHG